MFGTFTFGAAGFGGGAIAIADPDPLPPPTKNMSALSDYLTSVNRYIPPLPFFSFLFSGSGPPGDDTSPFYLFYIDDLTDKVYINPTRTSAAWTEIASADALGSGTILTADV